MSSHKRNQNLKDYGKKYPQPRRCPECTSRHIRQARDEENQTWVIVCDTCDHVWSRGEVSNA